MSRLSDGFLDDFGYQVALTSEGGEYERSDAYGTYKPVITIHLTATEDFSRESIARHGSPPHVWANYRRNELTQTVNLKRSARALYQQQFGEAWTNKHYLNLQVEWVKAASYTPTATDDELLWLATKVIVPFVLFIRSQGQDIQLRSEPTVSMSGAASVKWPYRYTEKQVAQCNWIIDHARWPHNDHWDVCAEDKVKIAAYAAADPRLQTVLVPDSGDDVAAHFYDTDGTLWVVHGLEATPMGADAGSVHRDVLKDIGLRMKDKYGGDLVISTERVTKLFRVQPVMP